MKVLCIGHSSYDIACPFDGFPIENTKYRINEVYESGGGPAANAAYLLGKWGISTYFAGAVGADEYGNKIKKELESVQVNTDLLEKVYDKPTSLSFIIANKNTGSRTLFNIAKEYPLMKKYDFNVDIDAILVDGHEYNASMAALNKFPNAISIIDAGRPTAEVLDLCKRIKYLVCSLTFAEGVSKMKADYNNPSTLVNIFAFLKKKYPKSNVIITLEDKGSLYSIGEEIKILPGLKLKAIDTTGAGDIFHGAFVYGLASGYDYEKSITYATIAAGLSTTKYGSRLSIPALNEVISYYNEKFPPQQVTQQNNVPAAEQSNSIQNIPDQNTVEQAKNNQDNTNINHNVQIEQTVVSGNEGNQQ